MYKQLLLMLITIVSPAFALQFGPSSEPSLQIADDIGLIVNNEAISRKQLAKELAQAKKEIPANVLTGADQQEVAQILLENVIMQHLLSQLSEQQQFSVTDETLEKGIQQIAQQNGVSVRQLFQKVQKDTGMSPAVYQKVLAKQIAQAKLKEEIVGPDINITQAQIDDQLAQIARQQGSTLHIQDLLLPVPNVAVDKRGQIISNISKTISAALKKYENDLSAVANEVPEARFVDLGEVNIARIPPRFARAVAGLAVGEIVATPTVDSDGMHFLKVVEKKSAGNNYIVPEARLSLIMIQRNPRNPGAAKRKIEQLYTRIQQGESFSDIARRYSQDSRSVARNGDLGWVGADQVEPKFAQMMLTINLNTVSQPFETEFGWHIILVKERRNTNRSEDKAREQIRAMLYQRALENAWQQKLVEIRQSAYIDLR